MGNYTTWLLLGLIVALGVVMVLNTSRQKKAEAEQVKQLGELRPGDKVKTHIGVYGKIVSITETTAGKVAVLEIGDKIKTQLEVDIRVIAGLDEKQIAVYDENNNLVSLDGKTVPAKEETVSSSPLKTEVKSAEKKPASKTQSKPAAKKTATKTAKK